MTYKENLLGGFERLDEGMLPMTIHYFLTSMAAILNICAAALISKSGEEITDVKVKDINAILTHEDLMNSITLGMQLNGFLNWLLDQEIDEDGIFEKYEDMWYGVNSLAQKWNDFAKEKEDAR